MGHRRLCGVTDRDIAVGQQPYSRNSIVFGKGGSCPMSAIAACFAESGPSAVHQFRPFRLRPNPDVQAGDPGAQ